MFTSQQALGGEVLTVASINLTFGRADADAVVALVKANSVEVLAAQEVTPEVVDALSLAGLDELFPYSQVAAEPGVTGTALWSRTPLTDAESLDGFVSRAVRADVSVNSQEVTLINAHPAAPGPTAHSSWDADTELLTAILAGQTDPTLVLGDFNTTRDHKAFRDIQALG